MFTFKPTGTSFGGSLVVDGARYLGLFMNEDIVCEPMLAVVVVATENFVGITEGFGIEVGMFIGTTVC